MQLAGSPVEACRGVLEFREPAGLAREGAFPLAERQYGVLALLGQERMEGSDRLGVREVDLFGQRPTHRIQELQGGPRGSNRVFRGADPSCLFVEPPFVLAAGVRVGGASPDRPSFPAACTPRW